MEGQVRPGWAGRAGALSSAPRPGPNQRPRPLAPTPGTAPGGLSESTLTPSFLPGTAAPAAHPTPEETSALPYNRLRVLQVIWPSGRVAISAYQAAELRAWALARLGRPVWSGQPAQPGLGRLAPGRSPSPQQRPLSLGLAGRFRFVLSPWPSRPTRHQTAVLEPAASAAPARFRSSLRLVSWAGRLGAGGICRACPFPVVRLVPASRVLGAFSRLPRGGSQNLLPRSQDPAVHPAQPGSPAARVQLILQDRAHSLPAAKA